MGIYLIYLSTYLSVPLAAAAAKAVDDDVRLFLEVVGGMVEFDAPLFAALSVCPSRPPSLSLVALPPARPFVVVVCVIKGR